MEHQQASFETGPRKIHFVANCMYGDHLAGGDIHFFKMAEAAIGSGYSLNFIGGHALEGHVQRFLLPARVTLTDSSKMARIDAGRISGQLSLFTDYFKRFLQTMKQLSVIQPNDVAYATTDYWFDVLPVVFSKASRKMMIWHMQAPTLLEIINRSRADVDAPRVASLHYWMSQNLSLRSFCRTPTKRVLFVHPDMRSRLTKLGCNNHEMAYASFGVDPNPLTNLNVEKKYDVVWIGRVHRQKGIDDLLSTLAHLAKRIPNFKAVIIGKVKSELEGTIQRLGLQGHVDFPGFVSEDEKFRLFAASRVYLMPSRFEGSPRVIGEALVCNLPVLAYAVPTYQGVFGGFVKYVPCFDVAAFQLEAERQINAMRSGCNYLNQMDLREFRQQNSWQTTQSAFLGAVNELSSS